MSEAKKGLKHVVVLAFPFGTHGPPLFKGCFKLSDTFFLFAVDMAKELHIPWVPLWTSEPRSLPFLLESDLVR
uniref:Uncharacterized protein n=1 Tax=Populus trichocarpa TaxID=3694 RepID=B9P509_POPTR